MPTAQRRSRAQRLTEGGAQALDLLDGDPAAGTPMT
jgi:hypothetical protein